MFTQNTLESRSRMVLINAIWRARNSLLWEDKHASPALVSQLAGLYLSHYHSAQPAPLHRLQQSPSHWSPPPVHWMKINVDGSFCSSTNSGGVRCGIS